MTDPWIADAVSNAAWNHIVPHTRKSYACAFGAYERFCDLRLLEPYPVDAVSLSGFLVRMSTSVAQASLGMYIAGIRFKHELQGFTWDLQLNWLVRRVLRYLKRCFPAAAAVPKFSIDVSCLRKGLPGLPGWPIAEDMTHNQRLFIAASLIGVAGFLRGGEFLCYPRSDRTTLLMSMMKWKHRGGIEVLCCEVPQPKSAWWLVAQDVLLFDGPPDFCPKMRWREFCELSPFRRPDGSFPNDLPAFHLEDGSPLSRSRMMEWTAAMLDRAGIPVTCPLGRPSLLRMASWRAGGVRSAMSAGVPTPVIMELGRWKSEAWLHYLALAPPDLARASIAMWRPVLGGGAMAKSPGLMLDDDDAMIVGLCELGLPPTSDAFVVSRARSLAVEAVARSLRRSALGRAGVGLGGVGDGVSFRGQ